MEKSQFEIIVYSRLDLCRYFYVRNCAARGYRILEANTLEVCEQLVLFHQPRLLLVCGLPSVEPTIAELRQSKILKDVPAITISIYERDAAWCQKWDVAVHLVHPPDIPELLELLNGYISPPVGPT
jgi:hypothetical protein